MLVSTVHRFVHRSKKSRRQFVLLTRLDRPRLCAISIISSGCRILRGGYPTRRRNVLQEFEQRKKTCSVACKMC